MTVTDMYTEYRDIRRNFYNVLIEKLNIIFACATLAHFRLLQMSSGGITINDATEYTKMILANKYPKLLHSANTDYLNHIDNKFVEEVDRILNEILYDGSIFKINVEPSID